MHQNMKTNNSWLKLTFGTKPSHLCQGATFLNSMVMHKENQKMKVLYLGSNKKKDPGKRSE